MDEKYAKKINALIFALFIIQIPAVAIKFYYLGISEETIGTYAVRGGGNTTTIPLLCLAYLFSFYSFYKKKPIYIILGIGFIAYGLVGAKAALLFLIPIALVGLYYLNYIKGKGFRVIRDLATSVLILTISALVVVAYVKYQPRLNRERKVGGSFDLSYALDYAKEYTTGESYKGKNSNAKHTVGRYATTKMVIEYIFDGGVGNIFFGYGPGILTQSVLARSAIENRKVADIKKSYGITGATFILVEYGVLGLMIIVSIYLIFIFRTWKYFKHESDPYWRAFSSGSFVFAILYLFIFMLYNTEPVKGDVIPPVYFTVMAIVYTRQKLQHRKIDEH